MPSYRKLTTSKNRQYKSPLARQASLPHMANLPSSFPVHTLLRQQCYKPFTSPINVQISKVIYSCQLAIRSTSCRCSKGNGTQGEYPAAWQLAGRHATIEAHKAAEMLLGPVHAAATDSVVGSVGLPVSLSVRSAVLLPVGRVKPFVA